MATPYDKVRFSDGLAAPPQIALHLVVDPTPGDVPSATAVRPTIGSSGELIDAITAAVQAAGGDLSDVVDLLRCGSACRRMPVGGSSGCVLRPPTRGAPASTGESREMPTSVSAFAATEPAWGDPPRGGTAMLVSWASAGARTLVWPVAATANNPVSPRKRHALELFAGLPARYDRMGAVLSYGQDPRWRRALVDAIQPRPFQRILDVATGTGMVAFALASRGCEVVGLDQSERMLGRAQARLAAIEPAPRSPAGSASSRVRPSSCRSPTAHSTL